MSRRSLSVWLNTALIVILLCAGCSNIPGAPGAGPTPTALATPQVHNDELPTDTASASTPTFTRLDPLPTQPPPQPGTSIFGAALDSITDEKGLSLMVEAGSAWTRRDFPWNEVEPEEGARQWENVIALETELFAAAENNMQAILIVGSSPDWAMDPNHPPCGGRISQEKFGALASFAHDLVARYSAPPFNVRYYELWNEPEVYSFLGCWGEPSDPLGYYGGVYYGEMLKVVYPAMKAANPDAQVMVGGLLLGCDPALHNLNADGSPQDCSMTEFFSGILASDAENAFDGISFHAYDYYHGSLGTYANENFAASWDTSGPVTLMKSRYLRRIMAAYGVSGKFLMNSEVALLCDGSACQTDEYQATKAFYVLEAYVAAQADGYVANVWYSVLGGRGNNLLTDSLEPLPALNTFKFAQTLLKDMQYTGQPNAGEGVRTYEFTNGSQRMVALWSVDGQDHPLVLTIPPQTVYRIGMDGNPIQETASTELNITRAPLIVVLQINP